MLSGHHHLIRRQGRSLRNWIRIPEGAGFLLGGTAVSTLARCRAEAWGLGAALLCWFHFSLVSAPWLEAGSGSEGLEPHYWLLVVSLKYVQGHMCWQSSWSEVGLGLELAPFPLNVHTLMGNGSQCLSGEKYWTKTSWNRGLAQAGACAGAVLEAGQSPS